MDTERKNPASGNGQSSGEQTAQTVAAAREQGKQAIEQGKQKVAEVAEEAKQKVSELADEAKTRASSEFDTRKAGTLSRLDGVASALRQTSHELQNQQDQTIARYTEQAADQVERFSHYIEQRDLGQLVAEVKNLAYRQPEIFVAGALAAGFLAGRFFKASGAAANQGYAGYEDRGYRDYDNYGYSNYGYSNYGPGGYGPQDRYTGDTRRMSASGERYGRSESNWEYGDRDTVGRYRQSGTDRSSEGQSGSMTERYAQTGGNYSGTGTQSAAGSSATSGIRTPATPTGSSQTPDAQRQDQGRSNVGDQPGRQGSSGSAAREQTSEE